MTFMQKFDDALVAAIARNVMSQLQDCQFRLDDRRIEGSKRIELCADLPEEEFVLAWLGPRRNEVCIQVLANHGDHRGTALSIHRIGDDTRISFRNRDYLIEGDIRFELDAFLDRVAAEGKALVSSA